MSFVDSLFSFGLSAISDNKNRKWQEKMTNQQNAFNEQQAEKSREFNAEQAQLSRDFSAEQAQVARDWNAEQDNTKYQRQVADMKAAGVNPALAMNGGVSTQATSNAMASAPSATSGAATGAAFGNPTLDLTEVARLNLQARQLKIEKERNRRQLEIQDKIADSEVAKNRAETDKIEKETNWIDPTQEAHIRKTLSDIDVNSSTIEVNGKRIDLYSAQTGLFNSEMSLAEKRAQLTDVQTAVERLNEATLAAVLPYQAQMQASIINLNNAKSSTEASQFIKNYADASAAYAKAAVDNGIVSSGYYEHIVGKIDQEKANLVQQCETEYWRSKREKREFKWSGINNGVRNACMVVNTAANVVGTVGKFAGSSGFGSNTTSYGDMATTYVLAGGY